MKTDITDLEGKRVSTNPMQTSSYFPSLLDEEGPNSKISYATHMIRPLLSTFSTLVTLSDSDVLSLAQKDAAGELMGLSSALRSNLQEVGGITNLELSRVLSKYGGVEMQENSGAIAVNGSTLAPLLRILRLICGRTYVGIGANSGHMNGSNVTLRADGPETRSYLNIADTVSAAWVAATDPAYSVGARTVVQPRKYPWSINVDVTTAVNHRFFLLTLGDYLRCLTGNLLPAVPVSEWGVTAAIVPIRMGGGRAGNESRVNKVWTLAHLGGSFGLYHTDANNVSLVDSRGVEVSSTADAYNLMTMTGITGPGS